MPSIRAGARVERLGLEARALRLFADCYYQPDPRLGGKLAELKGLAERLGSPAAAAAGAMLDHWSEDPALLEDYARLFLGPFSLLAPPYGSVYLDPGRGLMGPSAWAVGRQYRDAGLEPAPDFRETPDHIAAELEFLHYLAARQAQARQAGELELADIWRGRRIDFLDNYLGPWLGPFTRLVEDKARTGFYRALARATRLFILPARSPAPGRGRSWAPGAGAGGSRGR